MEPEVIEQPKEVIGQVEVHSIFAAFIKCACGAVAIVLESQIIDTAKQGQPVKIKCAKCGDIIKAQSSKIIVAHEGPNRHERRMLDAMGRPTK